MGEVVGPKKRENYNLQRNHARFVIEGIAEISRAREAIEHKKNDTALMFLCAAAKKIGAALGLLAAMADNKRKARSGARAKLRKNRKEAAKAAAMVAIHAEFDRWQCGQASYRNTAHFSRKMFEKYGDVLTNEGSIENACARWRKRTAQ